MCKRILVAMTVLMLIPFALAAQEKKVLQPEDHDKFTSLGAPAVSPDGKWIAFSKSVYDAKKETRGSDIFLIPFEGGKQRRLTATPGGEGGYAWSPCSTKIAFSARREGDKAGQVYAIDIGGGEARRLTEIESGASSPAWSPDGKTIAFYSSVGQLYSKEQKEAFGDVHYVWHLRYYHLGPGWDDGSRQRIFVIPSEGGEARQLTDGECADEGDHSMAWSPGSKEIAFVSNRSSEWWNTIDTDVYTVNVETGEARRLTDNPGPDHSPVYSPDGKWLAYRASYEYNYESENYKVTIMPAAGGEPKALTETLDRNVRNIAWNPAGNRIYFTASSEGNSNLQYVEIDKPDVFNDVTTGRNSIRGWSVVADDRFVYLNSTDVTPYDIHSLVAGETKQLTKCAAHSWEGYEVMPAEDIWITAEDGTKAQGWLIKPAGYEEGKRYPTILQIHGGPHGMYSPTLNYNYQLLAQRGYAVLFTNPRGSDGYGQAFADSIHEDWGTKPMADLMAFVDKVVEMGVADPDKLGVTGGSYGGYMTNWVIGHTDRFKAALTSAGLSNMVSFWGTTDEQFFAEKEMAGVPWTNKEAYLKNSPLWSAGKFVTPTMVVHGNDDWRVRIEQGEQIFTALQKMGVPSVFVNFPNEQHGVRGGSHRTLYIRLMLEWFDHWLQGKPVKLATYITPRPYVHPPKSADK